jgi:hypothetical protein
MRHNFVLGFLLVPERDKVPRNFSKSNCAAEVGKFLPGRGRRGKIDF